MTKFGQPPFLATKEHQKYGPANFQIPVPSIATQSITPRERGGSERGGIGGGSVSQASTIQSTPRDRGSVTSFHLQSYRKPADREKKWHLRGWDTDSKTDKQDDGIVGWEKRRTNLESKRGTKKHSVVIDNEHYYPVNSRCPATEDFEQFRQQSLHSRFLPKIKLNSLPQQRPAVTLRYSNTSKTENDAAVSVTAAGYRTHKEEGESDSVQRVMQNYRNAKHADMLGQGELLLGRRSKSVPDLHAKYNLEQRNKIKRLLKFSNKDRKFSRFDEDEDEGYSSKTSSAETKALSESDTEEGEDSLNKHRLSNSMIDLSELPSNYSKNDQEKGKGKKNEKGAATAKDAEATKVRFSYTHQPTILQIPHPDMKLVRDSVRADRAVGSEEVPFSYSRLKRAKEINKCYKIDPSKFVKENTVYDITTLRPRAESPKAVTLVLRKISIQDADKQVTAVMNTSTPPLNPADMNQVPGSDSRAGSRAGSPMSRAGSSASRIGSSKSRTGSAKSRVNSAASRSSLTPQMEFKNRMQQKHTRPHHYKDSYSEPVSKSQKAEPMWSQEYSLIERHATSYCIGDLLPVMDKSIYTNQFVKGKLGPKHQGRKYHSMAPLLTDSGKAAKEESKASAKDDGYLLLQKGMDMLTGEKEQPTLGPPPFRPTPARQQIVRNVKVVVRHVDAPRSSPIQGKGSYSPIRFNSERGPRPMMQSPEKETQRKLKEAFSKFYQNRPKEIGKEFRRMQTMWNG